MSLLSDMDGEIIADYRNPKKNGIGPSWLWNNPENRVYFRPFSVKFCAIDKFCVFLKLDFSAIDLLEKMLELDTDKRITAEQATQHNPNAQHHQTQSPTFMHI